MLTDIFANRYSNLKLFDSYSEKYQKLISQCFILLEQHVMPYYFNGNPTNESKLVWKDLHDKMAMELGLKHLSPLAYSYPSTFNGNTQMSAGIYSLNTVCENWMYAKIPMLASEDQFIKERISLIELGFRMQETALIKDAEKDLGPLNKILASGSKSTLFTREWLADIERARHTKFQHQVEELNARFRQSGCNLHYHNGIIQLSDDDLTKQLIEEPFWNLVANAKWKNVDTDMKEAINLRDQDGRNPAWYAARALESTIKIISDDKGWTHGKENGAQNYIENLGARKNNFLLEWETEILKSFFSKVRNQLGHGPGSAPMPNLSKVSTNWAIEFCMSWIKSLVQRS